MLECRSFLEMTVGRYEHQRTGEDHAPGVPTPIKIRYRVMEAANEIVMIRNQK